MRQSSSELHTIGFDVKEALPANITSKSTTHYHEAGTLVIRNTSMSDGNGMHFMGPKTLNV